MSGAWSLGRIAAGIGVIASCARPPPVDLARVCAIAPVATHTTWITPEIRAETTIAKDDVQSVQVRFVTGRQVMLVIALSQGANTAIHERGATIGSAVIEPGLRLDLQIATPLQDGAVYLDGTFASSNVSSVHFQGALATWRVAATQE